MGKLKKIQTNQKTIEAVIVPFSAGTGWNTISGTNLTFTAVQRSATNGRAFSNLYTSFNLPTNSAQTTNYTSSWVNTGMSGLNVADIIVVDIPNNTYGELIDGRTIKLVIPNNSGGTYDMYSSYYEPIPTSSDNSSQAEYFGNPIISGNLVGRPGIPSSNVAFLFCDEMGGPTLSASNTTITSWSNGWQEGLTPNGYVGAGTDNFRFGNTISSSNTPKAYAQTNDKPVGICYLDKGFIVLSSSALTTNNVALPGFMFSGASSGGSQTYGGSSSAFTQVHFTGATSASCSYYSFEKEWILSINIVADSGEFYITENQTAASSEAPNYGAGGEDTGIQFKTPFGDVNQIWDLSDISSSYITEIGLYDGQDRLLAIAKPDRPIKKTKNTPVNLTLKLKF
mgnify:CR=1 FL=1|tara:strand:+ start:1721 stop:2908 length:1188 start_codon:yes stop_codon:yes gene_type:complete